MTPLAKALISFLIVSYPLWAQSASDEYYLGGIQVNEPDHKKWVQSLKHHNMNTVSVTVYANQGAWDSADLYLQSKRKDFWAIQELKEAKASGLKVVFIPRVALDHAYPENAHLWHGMIMPKTDAQLMQWFKSYKNYLVYWAKIAEEEGADVFALGSELKELTKTVVHDEEDIQSEIEGFTDWYKDYKNKILKVTGDSEELQTYYQDVAAKSHAYLQWADQVYHLDTPETNISKIQNRRHLVYVLWKETISAVKEHYSGPLSYASNFDTYQNNALWPMLDIMGINAYFQLRQQSSVNPEENLQEGLNESWARVLAEVRSFKESQAIQDQAVIFTELGYTFKDNSSVEPWSYGGKSIVEYEKSPQLIDWTTQKKNYQERFQCLTALKQAAALPENDFFRGFLYWKFSTIKEHEEIEPYVMHLAEDSIDPALRVLSEMFTNKEP